MAVTLFQRTKIINRIRIVNKAPVVKEELKEEQEEPHNRIYNMYNAKIRGKTYGRRTICR